MKTLKIYLLCITATIMASCIDNNNKDNTTGAKNSETDYTQDAPTYNETQNDMEEKLDTVSTDKRIPEDAVERSSKGNTSSK